MTRLHLIASADTPLSSEQVRRALTDFSPRRTQLFSNVETGYLRASATGPTSAEVMEGSNVLGGIWECNRYDWSQPNVVRAETLDSNTWANGSFWIYRTSDRPGGGTTVELETVRIPKNVRGQLVALLLRLLGRRRLLRGLEATLKGIAETSAGSV